MTKHQPRIVLQHESDFVDAVPILIGFVPTDSLVIIRLQPRGDHALTVDLTARMDLPASATSLTAALDVIHHHVQDHPFVLIAYTTELNQALDTLERLTSSLDGRPELRAALIVVGDSRYIVDTEGRPQPVTAIDQNRIAAEAVLAGVPLPLPTRQALADTISRPTAETAHRTAEQVSAIRCGGRHLDVVALLGWLAEQRQLDWPVPTQHQLGTLIASVQDIDVRDAAWACISTVDAHRHLDLWRRAGNMVDGPTALPVLGLLGMAAWIDGQGALANLVLDRASETEGFAGYSLLGLLGELLGRGVDPACWERLRPTPDELGVI